MCFGFFMLVKYALKIRVDEQNEAFQESNLTTSLFFIVDIVVVVVVAVVVVFSFCSSLYDSLFFFFFFYVNELSADFSLSRRSYFNFDRRTNKSHDDFCASHLHGDCSYEYYNKHTYTCVYITFTFLSITLETKKVCLPLLIIARALVLNSNYTFCYDIYLFSCCCCFF